MSVANDRPITSKTLVVLTTRDGFSITQNPPQADYSVWDGGRIVAQGSLPLMKVIFERKIHAH